MQLKLTVTLLSVLGLTLSAGAMGAERRMSAECISEEAYKTINECPAGAIKSEGRKRAGQMPPGCECASVVLGKINPNQCKIYGRACTPKTPVGPCMVSDEGACRIWWAAGVRENMATGEKTAADSTSTPDVN